MKVKKRDGNFEKISFDRINYRVRKLAKEVIKNSDGVPEKLNKIDSDIITQKIISELYDGISSSEIDEQSARIAVNMLDTPEYQKLAARLIVSNLHKNTIECFSEVMELLYSNEYNKVLDDSFIMSVRKIKNEINDYIDYSRDYYFDYFGFKTLEKSYLLKINEKVIERPQHMYMRVAITLHGTDLEKVMKTYDYMSKGYYTHASPTLFNAGKKISALSSCFLLNSEDSMEGIYKTISDCAIISKCGGGIGVGINDIRGKGSLIRKTNGKSDGIVPMLKVYNSTAKYSNQSGSRKGSFAIYIEPYHADIMSFLELKLNQGSEELRARDLFYALWIPDLFMEYVKNDLEWYLMCPDECPGLSDVYGDEFKELYEKYISENKYKYKIKAQEIWKKILTLQIEKGVPYLLYKDSVNKKSNQKHIGTIKNSNLCVAGDTFILTKSGYIPIKNLVGASIEVWNGIQWSLVEPKKTGENLELFRITLNNGLYLDCTEYHKFYVKDLNHNIVMKRTYELNENDELLKPSYYPYDYNYQKAFNLQMEHSDSGVLEMEFLDKIIFYTNNANIQTLEKKKFLKMMYNKYGYDDNEFVYIQSIFFTNDYIRRLQLLLTTMNINSIKIKKFELVKGIKIHKTELFNMIDYLQDNKKSNSPVKLYDTFKLKVSSIKKLSGLHDTYCFTEQKRGMGVFNGILTGNCAEITLVSNPKNEEKGIPERQSVCNLASISLPKFVQKIDKDTATDGESTKKRKNEYFFNFKLLQEMCEYIIHPMNKVIDNTFYPTPETKWTNLQDRPLGIGVQGLHDTFLLLKYNFDSEEAKKLNKEIFETIYYGLLKGSCELAKKDGSYPSFKNSPMSKGILQFDMWISEHPELTKENVLSTDLNYNWDNLKQEIIQYGVRNSMLTCCMPTASTSQMLGNIECIEPFDSCIYKRRVYSGEYLIVNKHLFKELYDQKLWSLEMKSKINLNNGSIQSIPEIPEKIKKLYLTCWELKMKTLIDYSLDRSPFIDHTQSLNLFVQNPNYANLTSMHFYAWNKGLKTGIYYLRSKEKSSAGKFSDSSVSHTNIVTQKTTTETPEMLICKLENKDECTMCSS